MIHDGRIGDVSGLCFGQGTTVAGLQACQLTLIAIASIPINPILKIIGADLDGD